MKIRTSSWHYRLMQMWCFAQPKTLCSYFWMSVWSILLAPLLVIMAIVLLAIMAYPVWLHFISDAFGLGVVSFALWAFTLETVRRIYRDELRLLRWYTKGNPGWFLRLDAFWNKSLFHGVHIEKPESITIAGEYMRASKRKICPLIEYE